MSVNSIRVTAEAVYSDFEMGEAIIKGLDLTDLIREVGAEAILEEMDYEDIADFVQEVADENHEAQLIDQDMQDRS